MRDNAPKPVLLRPVVLDYDPQVGTHLPEHREAGDAARAVAACMNRIEQRLATVLMGNMAYRRTSERATISALPVRLRHLAQHVGQGQRLTGHGVTHTCTSASFISKHWLQSPGLRLDGL